MANQIEISDGSWRLMLRQSVKQFWWYLLFAACFAAGMAVTDYAFA